MRREHWICLVLGLVTLAVYWPVTRAEFINFDDPAYVTDNPHVEAGLTADGLVWALTTGHGSNWHPLTWLSHMADCQWFGLDAGRHHLVNLFFHAANTVLVFLWLRGLTGAVWRSALVAALFGWHPLHVESVAWISERKDVLSTFFCLLTLMAYGRYAQESRSSPKNNRRLKWYYALALVFFVLGLMSKPMFVTLPFVLLLLDWWPLERVFQFQAATAKPKAKSPGGLGWGELLLEKAPFLALAAGSSVVTFLVQQAGGAVIAVETMSVWQRIGNAIVSYVRYLGKTVWPKGLAMYYPVTHWAAWQVAGAALLLLVVTVLVFRERRRRPYLAVGWFWYLGTLVPVIGLVQVGGQAMADRYTYIPLIGIFIMAAWGLGEWLGGRAQLQRLAWGLAAPALAACLVLTAFQVRAWQTAVTLCRHTLAVTDKNARIENLLGLALMKRQQVDEAKAHFERAIEYEPEYAEAHGNLGRALLKKGNVDEALIQLRIAVEKRPGDPYFLNDAGSAYLQSGRVDEAMACFRAALKIAPDLVIARNNLGLALAAKGRLAEAVAEFKKAVEAEPGNASFQNDLGGALLQAGNLDEAIPHLQKTLEIQPDNVLALSNLGLALLRKGRLEQAVALFQKALAIQPGYSRALDNLTRVAWVLATCPDASVRNGARALELARQMEQASGGENPMATATLAAAYAETGSFADAIAAAERALRVANSQTNTTVAALLEAQLKSYQANQPFRDASQARPGGPN